MRDPDELQRENDTLRALLPNTESKCPYCGLKNMGECRHGFPGCPWADDLLCGEEDHARDMLRRMHEAQAYNQREAIFTLALVVSLGVINFTPSWRPVWPLLFVGLILLHLWSTRRG